MKSGLLDGYLKWRHGPYKAIARARAPKNGNERRIVQAFVAVSRPYSAFFGLLSSYLFVLYEICTENPNKFR